MTNKIYGPLPRNLIDFLSIHRYGVAIALGMVCCHSGVSGKKSMRLLVSSPNRLFLIDSISKVVGVVADDAPEYYGISWTPDGRELVTTHSCLDNASLLTLEHYLNSERGYLRVGSRRGVFGLSQPHQILCVGEFILVTNTGRNCLTIVRREDLFFRHLWIDDIRWDRKSRTDACGRHLNSVFVRGDRLWVLAHNHNRGSHLLEFSWPGLELLNTHPTAAHHAHNVWADQEGNILICDSTGPSLHEVRSARIVWKPSIANVMTRGLACSGNRVFVGMSRFVSREGRANSDGGVWVLDRSTWQEIDFIPLPGAGNIHEIRIVDQPDECHHGIPLRVVPNIDPRATSDYHALTAKIVKPKLPSERWTINFGTPTIAETSIAMNQADPLCLATFDGPTVSDVELSARIEATPTVEHRNIGLVARYTGLGDTNMVVGMVELVSRNAYVSLWQNVGGTWTSLAQTRLKTLPAVVSLEAVGNQLRLLVDGLKYLTAKTQVLAPGWVGVRGTTGRCAHFRAQALVSAGKRQPLFPPPAESRAA